MSLTLSIVTPSGSVYDGAVEQVVLPGSEGEFGVLERHERFLAPLRHGAIEIRTPAGTSWAAVSQGFADVSAERVVVMADDCALADEIDVAVAEEERRQAEEELRRLGGSPAEEQRRSHIEDVLIQLAIWIEVGRKGR